MLYNFITDMADDGSTPNPWADDRLKQDAYNHFGFDTDEELEAMQRNAETEYFKALDAGSSTVWLDHCSRAIYYPRIVLAARRRDALRKRIAARKAANA
jgi:hypothetical protein